VPRVHRGRELIPARHDGPSVLPAAQSVAELPDAAVPWLQDQSVDLYNKFVPRARVPA